MKVVLYKQCILNSQYTEVFRNKTLLEAYLSTLQSSNEIVIEETYTQLKGRLTLEFLPSKLEAYNYNYMKFIGENNETIYCFIDNIEFSNDCTIFNYTCDIWHTFDGKWNIRESLCTRSRYTKAGEHFELPLDPITNRQLRINSFRTATQTTYALIIELQLYKLAGGGEIKQTYTQMFCVGRYESGTSFNLCALGFDTIDTAINDITFNQAQGGIGRVTSTEDDIYRYSIINTYIIPYYWLAQTENIVKTRNNNNILRYDPNASTQYDFMPEWSLYDIRITDTEIQNAPVEVNRYTLTSDRKIKSYGFFSKQIPYHYNGLAKYIRILMYIDKYSMNLYLSSEDGLHEITDIFTYTLNFQVIDASSLKQQEIARKLQNVHGWTQVASGTVQIAGEIMTMGASAGASGAVTEASNMLSKFNQNQIASNLLSATSGYGEVASGTSAMASGVSGIGKIASGIATIQSANAQKYANSRGVNNNQCTKKDVSLDLCYLSVDPDYIINENEVDSAINEVGYGVEYFVNSIDIVENISDYNVVQFDFVRINGITREVNDVIEAILTSGVKIWYRANV